MTVRLLITGSRNWTDFESVYDVIARHQILHGSELVVVAGDAVGADTLAKFAAEWLGVPFSEWKAEWKKCDEDCRHKSMGYCPVAGYRRNQQMVDAGVNICEAFDAGCDKLAHRDKPPHPSHGTADCAHRVVKAGIPVTWNKERKRDRD